MYKWLRNKPRVASSRKQEQQPGGTGVQRS